MNTPARTPLEPRHARALPPREAVFGRLSSQASHRPLSDINVTPLVDVMLVLLVIFIMAAPLMASRIALELPQVQSPAAPMPAADSSAVVALSVDALGRTYWDDQPINTPDLRLRLQHTAQRNPATELHLRADTKVPYGHVAQLMALAQEAGLSRIGFVTDSPPLPTSSGPR